MTIKVKLRGNKAIVRYNNQMEESYFIHVIRSARDDHSHPHPEISLKGQNGEEIPPRKPEKPVAIKDVKIAENVKPMKVEQK